MTSSRPTETAQWMDERRLSFGRSVVRYDAARPDYPAETVGWLVGGSPCRVLDVGCGTGKFTATLASSGHEVTALDPDTAMLRRLTSRVPGVHAAAATAERLPLKPRSVDAVVAAQALHWFDLDRAVPEIARVLRPQGVLAMLWNVRDEGSPWVKRLGRLLPDENIVPDVEGLLGQYDHFGEAERRVFRHWHLVDRQSLLDLVSTYSAVAVLADSDREALLVEVGDLYDSYGRGADGMRMPLLTHAFRAVVRRQDPADLEDTQPMNAGSLRRREPDAPAEPPNDDDGTLLIDFR